MDGLTALTLLATEAGKRHFYIGEEEEKTSNRNKREEGTQAEVDLLLSM